MVEAILKSVIAGWLWRRVQEVASFAAVLVPVYLAMPPEMQETVRRIFTGGAGELSVSAYLGLGYYLFTQIQSYRATTVPQVVTPDGQKIMPKKDSVAMERVEVQAKAAPKRGTLAEKFFGRIFNK